MKLLQILEKVDWKEYLCLDDFGPSAEKMFAEAIKMTNKKGISYFVNDELVTEGMFEQARDKLAVFSNEQEIEPRSTFTKNGYLPPTVYEEKRTVKKMYFVFK